MFSLSVIEEKERELLAERQFHEIKKFLAEQDALETLFKFGHELETQKTRNLSYIARCKLLETINDLLFLVKSMSNTENAEKVEKFVLAIFGELCGLSGETEK